MTLELARRELFGLRFIDACDVGPVIEALLDGSGADPLLDDPAPVVVTPNVDLLVHLARGDSPPSVKLVHRAAYVLADGQPVVWASRLFGAPLATRLAGSTLVAGLWPRIMAERRSVLVIAASESLADLTRAEYPKARVVVAPFFAADDADVLASIVTACATECAGDSPEFVLVGLSYPKQYVLIDALLRTWPSDGSPRVYLAVGASFEMYYGLRKRSPEWLQRVGMEWFYRFAQEPRRLFRRYFVDDLAFGRIVWREYRVRTKASPAAGREREIGAVLPGPWPAKQHPEEHVRERAN